MTGRAARAAVLIVLTIACGRSERGAGPQVRASDRASISVAEVVARGGPSMSAAAVATLSRGMELTIGRRERDFFAVTLPDRREAFVPSGAFERLSDREARSLRARSAAGFAEQRARAVEPCPILLAPDYGAARWGSLAMGDDVAVVLTDHDFYGIRLEGKSLAFVPARSLTLLPSPIEERADLAGLASTQPVVRPPVDEEEQDVPALLELDPGEPVEAPEAPPAHEPPELIASPEPRYPDFARRKAIGGEVILRILVDEKGTVADVEVVQGAAAGLTEAAVDAVKQRRYRPARRNGQVTQERIQVTIRFTASR